MPSARRGACRCDDRAAYRSVPSRKRRWSPLRDAFDSPVRTGSGRADSQIAVGRVSAGSPPATADLYRMQPPCALDPPLPDRRGCQPPRPLATGSGDDEQRRRRSDARARTRRDPRARRTDPASPGPERDQPAELELDAVRDCLDECTRCRCVVTSRSGHEAAMHPGRAVREHGPFGGVTGNPYEPVSDPASTFKAVPRNNVPRHRN